MCSSWRRVAIIQFLRTSRIHDACFRGGADEQRSNVEDLKKTEWILVVPSPCCAHAVFFCIGKSLRASRQAIAASSKEVAGTKRTNRIDQSTSNNRL